MWRLETMALMSDVDLPAAHVREQVTAAIDVVVHMGRLRGGRRLVLEIATVDGLRDGEPVLTTLFAFRRRTGGDGERFEATGAVPELAGVLADRGEPVPDELFLPGPDRTTARRPGAGVKAAVPPDGPEPGRRELAARPRWVDPVPGTPSHPDPVGVR